MDQFGKSETEDFGFLCIEKEGTQFGFGGRCGNKFEYHTRDVDGAVEFDRIAVNRETNEEEVAASMALCTRGGEKDVSEWTVSTMSEARYCMTALWCVHM